MSESRFKRENIILTTNAGERMVEASILGRLAVHQSLRGPNAEATPDSYTITHLPTGLWIKTWLTKRDAFRLTRALQVLDLDFETSRVPHETAREMRRIIGELGL